MKARRPVYEPPAPNQVLPGPAADYAYRPPPGGEPEQSPKNLEAVRLGYELCSKNLLTSQVPSTGQEVVFSTSRRWKGIDIYAELPRAYFVADGAYLRVFVYAINEVTGRTLVGSGLVGGFRASSPNGALGPFLVASVHTVNAQRFEVAVSLAGGTATASDPWRLNAIATDQATTEDPDAGAQLVAAAGAVPAILLTSAVLPAGVAVPLWKLKIHRVIITNATGNLGAPRWLQFHDQATAAACVGATPYLSIGVPLTGEAVIVGPQQFRPFINGFVAFPSTSAIVGAAAAANDIVYSVWLK